MQEDDLLMAWLSDQLVNELEDEEVALIALKVAEERVRYNVSKKEKLFNKIFL